MQSRSTMIDEAIELLRQGSYSSIGRQLQFLKSHTIHHYALIALFFRLQDYEPPEEYGVSTSTPRQRRAA